MYRTTQSITVGIMDHRKLFRSGLCELIPFIDRSYAIRISVSTPCQLFKKIEEKNALELLIINMENISSHDYGLIEQISQQYPETKILAIIMDEEETDLIKMLKNGVRGFINRDVEPNELKKALEAITLKGYHYSEQLRGRLVAMMKKNSNNILPKLTKREMEFVNHIYSEDTYLTIAKKMQIGLNSVKNYQTNLFRKLDVKSRLGIVMFAIKHELVEV